MLLRQWMEVGRTFCLSIRTRATTKFVFLLPLAPGFVLRLRSPPIQDELLETGPEEIPKPSFFRVCFLQPTLSQNLCQSKVLKQVFSMIEDNGICRKALAKMYSEWDLILSNEHLQRLALS